MSFQSLYEANIRRRRSFRLPGYATLQDVGLDGPYVTPLQIISRSEQGPVLVAKDWFDAPSALLHREELREYGYKRGIPFNNVLDRALLKARLTRGDIYLTQAFHLLPQVRSASTPLAHYDASFDHVTRHELIDRRVVALGGDAARMCKRHGVQCVETVHPSSRVGSYDARAAIIAGAIASVS